MQFPAPSQLRAGVKVEPAQVAGAQVVVVPYTSQAPAPLHRPSLPQVAAAAAWHWLVGLGACPAAIGLQVPSLPAIAHDRQVPVQLDAQQTPCWQKPDAQSVVAVQVAPSGLSAQLAALQQIVPLQVYPAAQSAVVAQVVRQSPPAPQTYGEQASVVPATQSPTPSQRPASVSVPPVQASVPQTVPETASRQAPAPSQRPSVPQAEVVLGAHWASGSWPAGTLAQVPTLPAIAQDMQVPVQALAQQIPCAQNPELQSVAAAQLAPMGPLPQLPFLHVLPAEQSASTVQVVWHWPPVAQENGTQDWLGVVRQVPRPSQRPAKVSVDPVHPPCWQSTPAG